MKERTADLLGFLLLCFSAFIALASAWYLGKSGAVSMYFTSTGTIIITCLTAYRLGYSHGIINGLRMSEAIAKKRDDEEE